MKSSVLRGICCGVLLPERSKITRARLARRVRVPVSFACTAVYIWLARPTWKSILFGAIFVAVGIIIRALASGQLKKNEELATSGLYAYTRNPLYLGSLILGVGFTVASRSWGVATIIAAVFALIYVPVIKAEEAFLQAQFPQFDDYAREVSRFIPRPNSRPYDHQFSWALYLKHREYNAVLGSAALIAVLIVKLFLGFA